MGGVYWFRYWLCSSDFSVEVQLSLKSRRYQVVSPLNLWSVVPCYSSLLYLIPEHSALLKIRFMASADIVMSREDASLLSRMVPEPTVSQSRTVELSLRISRLAVKLYPVDSPLDPNKVVRVVGILYFRRIVHFRASAWFILSVP
jgi:hypothetical protein